MSQVLVPGWTTRMPDHGYFTNITSSLTTTLDATGETSVYGGYIMLEDPEGGNKVISAAGGGKIVWVTGAAVTFADVASVFKVGIQDISTTTSPMQGDGTFDVSKTYTGSGLAASSLIESVMDTGTKTISHGQDVAIVLEFTTRAGADSVVIQESNLGTNSITSRLPAVTNNTTGAYAARLTLPNALIVFDDGTLGWFYGCTLQTSSISTGTISTASAVTDEIGTLVTPRAPFKATGITGVFFCSATSDFELIAYKNPLSATPEVLKTISVDATKWSAPSSSGVIQCVFDAPILLDRGTDYASACRPTTTNALSVYYAEKNTASYGNMGPPNADCYGIGRADNTGAFTDWNGGTAKTRVPLIWFTGTYMANETHNASFQLGI